MEIAEIEAAFQKYASKLGLKEADEYLSFDRLDDGSPHVEIVNDKELHYVVTERGNELERRKTDSVDQLMYWLFSGIVFSIALDYELNNRHPTNDFRRLLFAKEFELLETLNPQWRVYKEKEIVDILQKNPYKDG
ncbi:MAG: Imm63 family immunity protein [Candidatus Sedimenticola sp. 20ELBAFRAG]